jgi:hypothetical protein
VLQRSDDMVRFFEEHLLADGHEHRVRRYLRVCHDICHSSVMFEDQEQVLERYRAAGIQVGKVQISSAIVLRLEEIAGKERAAAIDQLRSFTDKRYLHQTMIRRSEQVLPEFFEDLPAALQLADDSAHLGGSWRVHYHVPIYLERFGALETSQDDIRRCLAVLKRLGEVRHYEVETYGWGLLPRGLQRSGLADGIADELRWLQQWL